MTPRSLRVWLFAFALLGALAVSARAGAKPPDLPVDPNDTIPLLAPSPDAVEPDDCCAPAKPMPEPMPGWPTITISSGGRGYVSGIWTGTETDPSESTTLTIYPGTNGVVVGINPSWTPPPQTVTIYHAVRPSMALSIQRTVDECLLFGVHPLLSLLPLPESLREERHTQEMVPVAPLPQVQPNGVLLFGVGVNSDAGLTGSIGYAEQPSSEPEPIKEMPQPRETNEPSAVQVCPYHGPCDRYVPALADEDISRSVLKNLEKLVEAETLYKAACQLTKCGRYAEAMACMGRACQLCPASRYEEMSSELVSDIVCRVLGADGAGETGAEEADEPPTQCQPYWFGDEDDSPDQGGDTKLKEPPIEKAGGSKKEACSRGCGEPDEVPCQVAGVAVEVTGLLKACHLALGCGNYAKATQLAREAYALDAERVAADPVIYKMHLLTCKMDKCRDCCDGDECCGGDKDCCCPGKIVVQGRCAISGLVVNNLPKPCVRVQLLPPSLPPLDATVIVELQKLLDEETVETATAKPALEVVEEESEVEEAPKAVDKPYRVQAPTMGMVISFDELLKFLPGETWTEFDPKTNHVRALYRVRVGSAVYCVRYDGDLSVDLTVTPETGNGEKCEDHK